MTKSKRNKQSLVSRALECDVSKRDLHGHLIQKSLAMNQFSMISPSFLTNNYIVTAFKVLFLFLLV